MKKIITAFFFAALVAAAPGCLKDKGFEDHQYGINDPDNSVKGVGFPLAANAANSRAVEVRSTVQTIDNIVINLESGEPAPQDVHVRLRVNSAIVTNYNNNTGGNLAVLPTSAYSFPVDVVIPKGERFASFSITIPNTSTLDASKTYGIGISIESVDGNYKIASNLQNLLISVNIKNKYDGRYTMRGYFNHPSYANNYVTTIELWTTGPTTNVMYSPLFDELSKPFNVGGGSLNRFADIAPVFNVDPVTNKVTVTNYFSGGSALSVDPNYNNRYDPVTKTYYVKYGYNAARTRDWTDTLIYIGKR